MSSSLQSLVDALGTQTKRVCAYGPTNIIIEMGSLVQRIGLILEGEVAAHAYSVKGQKIWIDRFGPNSFIGYETVCSGYESLYEVTATAPTTIAWINKDDAAMLFLSDPPQAQRLQSELSSRIHFTTMRLIEAVSLTATGRVCSELKRMAKPFDDDLNKWIIRPGPIFVDVALRVSSTRETVSRTVARMRDLGIISREIGAILIHDMDRLEDHIQ